MVLAGSSANSNLSSIGFCIEPLLGTKYTQFSTFRDLQSKLNKSEVKVTVLTGFLESILTPQQIDRAIQKMEQKLGIDITHGLPTMPKTLNDKLSYLMSLEKKAKET